MAETKKRAPAWLVSHKELQDGGDGFKEVGSKSKNSAFLNEPMTGKVYGIYNQGKLII